MLTNDQLRDILRKAVDGKPSAWANRYGLQKSNICCMISGKRKITERVASILGYERKWVKK